MGKIVYGKDLKESAESKRVDKIYDNLLKGKSTTDITGLVTLADIEIADGKFFVPYSSFEKFPKKRPMNGTWNCIVKFNDGGEWRDCVAVCILPFENDLRDMGMSWDDVTPSMLLVEDVYII